MAVDTIGVISGLIGIFSFAEGLLPTTKEYSTKFRLAIAGDYAGDPNLPAPMNSGGTPPDARIFDPQGNEFGIVTNDENHCDAGNIVCDFEIDNTVKEPAYTLFTGNNDAICITDMRITYPNGQKYAIVIGNWAEECNTHYGNAGASWYYTQNSARLQDNTLTKVQCAWLDSNGDLPTTGIQVNWPQFDAKAHQDTTDPGYFCNQAFYLDFHTDNDPNYVLTPAKRDVSSSDRSTTKRGVSSEQFSHRLVKSHLEDQTASHICTAPGAAGPSFVSFTERQFCHMPTKTLWPFCEDVTLGACYDDNLELVVPKLVDNLVVPFMNFTHVNTWTGLLAPY